MNSLDPICLICATVFGVAALAGLLVLAYAIATAENEPPPRRPQ